MGGLLKEALGLDPNFFIAYCTLASVHDQIYLAGLDHTPSRLGLARGAIDAALGLRPDSGEGHLALADHLYCGYLDYERARAELAIARDTLPNESRVFELTSYIDRRQGRWDESLLNLKRALELDPRSLDYAQQLARSYGYLRRFSKRPPSWIAHSKSPRATLAYVCSAPPSRWKLEADTRPLRAVIDALLQENPPRLRILPINGVTSRFANGTLKRRTVLSPSCAKTVIRTKDSHFPNRGSKRFLPVLAGTSPRQKRLSRKHVRP